MKKPLLLSCLLLAACGGPETPEPTTESLPLESQEASIEPTKPTYWYTCNLPCRTGYAPTSSIYYPDCAPYGSTTRWTCTLCNGPCVDP